MSIAPVSETTIAPAGANLGRVASTLPAGLEFDQWQTIGGTLRTIRDSSLLWWWGDWLNYGETRYGETYAQALEGSDYAYGTLANAAYVCGRIAPSRRREGLTFSHHQEVAPLEPAEQEMWLDDAADNGWSSKELRAMLRQTRAANDEVRKTESAATPADPDDCGPDERGDALTDLHRALALDLDLLYQCVRAYEANNDLPAPLAAIMARLREAA